MSRYQANQPVIQTNSPIQQSYRSILHAPATFDAAGNSAVDVLSLSLIPIFLVQSGKTPFVELRQISTSPGLEVNKRFHAYCLHT